MSRLILLQSIHQKCPLLRSGAISLGMHIAFFGVISLLPAQNFVQPEKKLIQVTLVEHPSLDQGRPTPEPAPPLLHTPRPSSRPMPRTQTSRPVTFPSTPLTSPKVVNPVPPPRASLVKRTTTRLLRDSKAADTLTMQSLLKTARKPSNPSTVSSTSSPATSPPSTLPAIPQMIWAQDSTTRNRNHTKPSLKSHRPLMLSAANSQHHSPSASKVQLGETFPPAYPRIAREQGWEGTVFVRASIFPDGKPRNLRVRKSSGYDILDKAALEAVRSWRFIPARDGNIPITTRVDIPIHFDLKYTRKTGQS